MSITSPLLRVAGHETRLDERLPLPRLGLGRWRRPTQAVEPVVARERALRRHQQALIARRGQQGLDGNTRFQIFRACR